MKVIDLLNLVYEKKAPKKILYKYCEYEFCEECNDYINKNDLYLFEYLFKNEEKVLNLDIEIIEDKPKKIEQIDLFDNFTALGDTSPLSMQLQQNFQKINEKFDEAIDRLNYLLEKSDKDE